MDSITIIYWISRRIYVDTIEVALLDDANSKAIVIKGNLVKPHGITVDPNLK